MKAVVYSKYGPPEVLELAEVPKPVPGENEVLVKVHAASVNSWDWDLVTGKPYVYRLLFGVVAPKFKIIGSDLAGTIEAVGKNVKHLRVGDAVFGDNSGYGFGTFAEYVCVNENIVSIKPGEIDFNDAAALPQAGVLALQGLRLGKVKEGTKLLINGAGGGVGAYAIQLAKLWGANVTAVDHGGKLVFLHSLGADHVLDYARQDFTRSGNKYDVILDVVARRSAMDYTRALNPDGSFIMIGGAIPTVFQTVTSSLWLSFFSKKKMELLMHKPNREDLDYLKELLVAGKLKSIIDKRFSMAETAKAVRYLGEGKAKGKVVISLS